MGPQLPAPTPVAPPAPTADDHRSRRSVLLASVGAVGAFVVQALGRPAPVSAADVVLGATNNTTTTTTIQNTAASATAKAIVGKTTYTGSASTSRGVSGFSAGEHGVGVYGEANKGTAARGIHGASTTGVGVRGSGGTTGVKGTGSSYGVYGESTSSYGVAGAAGYAGVLGTGGTYGFYGTGTSAGVVGTSTTGYGVHGEGQTGVVGEGDYRGLYGSGGNAGVYGTSDYVGVWGAATATSGVNYGVYASTSSSAGYAGVFSGPVYVSGFLTKVGGGFKIDHPMEPETKYLVHSFVESPEMLNVYSGVTTLDDTGTATVKLPRYFEAENRDFRYQLTAIGAAAPNLHVATGVANNAFKVAGGAAGQQVSWQVTGVRNDAWAKANPLEVEPAKAQGERGRFLQPAAHGKPGALAIMAIPTVGPEAGGMSIEPLKPAPSATTPAG